MSSKPVLENATPLNTVGKAICDVRNVVAQDNKSRKVSSPWWVGSVSLILSEVRFGIDIDIDIV